MIATLPTPRRRPRARAVLATLLPCLAAVAAGPPDLAGREARLADAAFEAHNRLRAEAKLPPLSRSPLLDAAARAHAADMASRGEMSHTGADGSQAARRIERQDYPFRNVGENVAFGQRTVEQVMDGWMDSPGHKKNILGNFAEVGIGVALDGDGRPYWCVNFATPWPKLDPASARRDVLDAVNRERARKDLPPLRGDERLDRLAESRAVAFARGGPEAGADADQDARQRAFEADLRRSGYRFRSIMELAAGGQPGPREFVASLLDDPGQRDAVLGSFRDVGIGLAAGDRRTPFWALILANPR